MTGPSLSFISLSPFTPTRPSILPHTLSQTHSSFTTSLPHFAHPSFISCPPSSSSSVSLFPLRASATEHNSNSNSNSNSSSDQKQPFQRPKKPEQTFFGLRLRNNGDVLKFGVVATIIPFGIKALIQAALVQFFPDSKSNPDLLAGQLTTAFISIFALLAWVSTYLFRVGTKQMTYAQQLKDYEDQVIQKRYEELTEEELAALTDELNDES